MPRIFALDIGTVRIGVATTDDEQIVASPLETVDAKPMGDAVARIRKLVDEHDVNHIVYGLPLDLDGGEGRAARRTRRFVTALERQLDFACEPVDERLTSVVAERALIEADVTRAKRKKVVDQLAATLILQSWLQQRGRP